MKKTIVVRNMVMLATLLTSGTVVFGESSSGANLTGVNHTQKGISSFMVNDYRGQMGGYSCCIMLPDQWRPGLKVEVKWMSDPNPNEKLPPLGTDEYRTSYAKHAANYKNHSEVVDIPKYNQACDLVIHFLPCDQVKATAICSVYGREDYPIKEPLNMSEPKTCPR
ncbi:MAG: DUF3304 domain-containing protein [Hafnia sp.]